MHQLQPLEGALVVESNKTTRIKNKKSGSLNKNGLYNTLNSVNFHFSASLEV